MNFNWGAKIYQEMFTLGGYLIKNYDFWITYLTYVIRTYIFLPIFFIFFSEKESILLLFSQGNVAHVDDLF